MPVPVIPSSVGFGQLVLTSSVIAALVGTLATQATTWLREGRSSKRETDYLALRLATVFERYSEEAADFLGGLQDFTTGMEKGVSVELPVLRPLPDEEERWRDLDVRLTSRALGFEEYRRSRQGGIDQTWRHGGPHDAIETARAYSTILGRVAFELAADLRASHRLPAFDTASSWPLFLSNEYDALPEHWKDHPNLG